MQYGTESNSILIIQLDSNCNIIFFFQRKADPGQFRQAVEWGIEAGYRHIDTASSYGNEEEVGEGINYKIKDGTVTRDQLFVTTKASLRLLLKVCYIWNKALSTLKSKIVYVE